MPRPCPKDKKLCLYKIIPESLKLQRNALRAELITPSVRCGYALKDTRVGGMWEDYLPCYYG
jgi:hypothetical protein